MSYPVSVTVEPLLTGRNRLTTAFRLILAIPHALLVGGVGFSIATRNDGNGITSVGGETGLLGVVAWVMAIISWFTIVFAGSHIIGIRQFCSYFLRWRVRALAYMMLLEDRYPPFGDDTYPAGVAIVDPPGPRDRLTVAFRIFLAIPHFIVLFFLLFGWWLTAIVAWFVILFTGAYPEGLYEFGVGCLRWLTRVQAYMLLLVDEYPPFTLTD
jgi:uncharacterized protein DUF4389